MAETDYFDTRKYTASQLLCIIKIQSERSDAISSMPWALGTDRQSINVNIFASLFSYQAMGTNVDANASLWTQKHQDFQNEIVEILPRLLIFMAHYNWK